MSVELPGFRVPTQSPSDEQIIEESYKKFCATLGPMVLQWVPMFGLNPEEYKKEIRRVIELVKQRERNAK